VAICPFSSSVQIGEPEARQQVAIHLILEKQAVRVCQRQGNQLTSISLIKCPGAMRTVNPTTMPATMDTTVSWIARIRLICR
jgi:hypothetical protein